MAVKTCHKTLFAGSLLLLLCYNQGYCRTLQDDVNIVTQIFTLNGITSLLFMDVADVRNNRATSLKLNNLNISVLPDIFWQLDSLSSLDLRYNALEQLPDSIGLLTQLTTMSLQGNKLASLPTSFGELAKLKSLSLQGNKLSSLPFSFGKLSSLSSLWLGDINTNEGNLLTSLPDTIGNLKALNFLDVSNNLLVQIPPTISNIRYLYTLNLKNNKLATLPKYCFTYLRGSLELSYNEFVVFPDIGGNYLEYLYISYNHLKTLPFTFNNYEYLSSVDASHNEMDTFPDILAYMMRLKNINLDSNQIVYISSYIGNKSTSSWLLQIKLNDNQLKSLPNEITKLHADVWVRRNMICSLDTSTASWLDRTSTDKNWRTYQRCSARTTNNGNHEFPSNQIKLVAHENELFLSRYSNSESTLRIELFDCFGKKVKNYFEGASIVLNEKTPMSIQCLPEGRYFLRIHQGNLSYLKPIIKIK
jgi:Leucine-rich repeat (LRR) protein